MGQYSKYSFEMKLAAATKYLEGSCSTESIARNLGTNGTRIIEWATIYQSLGGRRTKNHPKAQRLFGGNKTQGCLRLSFWQRDVKGNPEKIWNPFR